MFTLQYDIDNQNNLLNIYKIKNSKNTINNISEIDDIVINKIINEQRYSKKSKLSIYDELYDNYYNVTNDNFFILKFYLSKFSKYNSNNNNYYNIILDYIIYNTQKYGLNFDIKFFYIEIIESIILNFKRSNCDNIWYNKNSECYRNETIMKIFRYMLLHFKKCRIKFDVDYNSILLVLFLNDNFTEIFVGWYDYIEYILDYIDMYKKDINDFFNNNDNNNNIAVLILNKIYNIITIDENPDNFKYIALFLNIKTINSVNKWYIPTYDCNNDNNSLRNVQQIKNLVIQIFDILVVHNNIINTIEFSKFMEKYYPLYHILLKNYDSNKKYINSNIYTTPTLFKIHTSDLYTTLESRNMFRFEKYEHSPFYSYDHTLNISRV